MNREIPAIGSSQDGSSRKASVRKLAAIGLVLGLGLAPCGAAFAESWEGRTRDAWIDGKIEAAYALNRYLDPFAIDTEVEGGVVRLSGSVESQIDKDLAQEIAEGVDGVSRVDNELVVEASAEDRPPRQDEKGRSFGTRVDDATTTARVKLSLLANRSAQGLAIDVDTENGIVSLEGSVASKQERELAERIARNTDGVSRVENRLEVEDRS